LLFVSLCSDSASGSWSQGGRGKRFAALDTAGSIEPQPRLELIVIHGREIILGIHVSCPAEEELVEGLESSGSQRINDTTKGDLGKKPLCARDGHELEMVREYSGPV